MIAVTVLKILVGVFIVSVAALLILIVSMVIDYRRYKAENEKELRMSD